MRLRIHRGTREIGGTCVEVEASGARILLDLGMPLDVPEGTEVPLPDVPGLSSLDSSLKAVILSHGHRDHWGLLPKVAVDVPLILGAATERMMRAAAPFIPNGFAPKASSHLVDRQPIEIGPFRITPYLMDHSGFDAYAILVEASGKRLFYSGDLRGHGRKGKLFEALLNRPPQNVDTMLMEGSSLGRIADDASFPTETDLEEIFVDRFRSASGFALVACSAQNIDRVVTIYRAAKRSGRKLIVDAYAAEVLKATGYPSIPKPADDWSDVRVWIPQSQRRALARKGIAPIVDAYKGRRVWPQNLASEAPKSVMLIRPWMLGELSQRDALVGASVFWSQWEGYLKDGPGAALKAECERREMPFKTVHTSGHASPVDLKRLAEAVATKRLIAIHTFAANRYPDLFQHVVKACDGEWIAV